MKLPDLTAVKIEMSRRRRATGGAFLLTPEEWTALSESEQVACSFALVQDFNGVLAADDDRDDYRRAA